MEYEQGTLIMASSGDLKLGITKLNSDNYQMWKFKMEMLLSKDDTWDVLTTDRPDVDNQEWDKKNRQARATIALLVEDEQLIHIKGEDTAKGMWNALRRLHESSSLNNKLYLLRKLYQSKLTPEGDMQEHIRSVLEIVAQLRDLGEEIKDNHVTAILLCSLPESYNPLINALETRSEAELTLQLVKSRLSDEYKRRKEQTSHRQESDTGAALKATDTKMPNWKAKLCFRCNRAGHFKRDCPLWRNEQREKDPNQALITMMKNNDQAAWHGTFKVTDAVTNHKWYIDSGATSHMTNDREFFVELNPDKKEAIYLADGSCTTAEGTGHRIVTCKNEDGQVLKIPMTDVLYVPGLNGGLISVRRLASKGLTTTFKGDQCTIQDGERVIATAKAGKHLYELDVVEQETKLCTHKHKNCIHLWHRRLGHRHPDSIQELARRDLTKGFKLTGCPNTLRCECCIKAKATRVTPPKASESRATRPIDLIHTDVCGPMRTTTPGGNKYILTFIDDYSRFTVTYLMKNKSEVFDKLKDYVTKVSNKFHRKPLVLRSDNGGEYTGFQVENTLRELGIEHQKTVPYTPEQNGVAERKNRSLTEMIRCMLTDSGLPEKYWGEAAQTATYLQNRLHSKATTKTPYELWHSRKPSIGHLKVFGSKAFAYIPGEKRSKLQNRAIEGVFVGYADNTKGYRIIDPKTDKVTISSSVTFIEDPRNEVTEPAMPRAEEPNNAEQVFFPMERTPESDTVSQKRLEQTEPANDAEPRRSMRENRGKPPNRLSYKVETSCVREPTCWKDITQLPEREAKRWIKAAEEEIISLQDTQAWVLTQLPAKKRAIGCKWTFKVKYNTDGTVERYKARLVAKGYSQKYGEDYDETFAPVVKHTTIRALLTVATTKQMLVKHFDVKTAFLHSDLTEDIYMEQPEGFVDPQKPEQVCKLKKGIYGLKQAARAWNMKINEALLRESFQRSKADPCLYTKKLNGRWIFVLIYVDDLLVCYEQEGDCSRLLEVLNMDFETKDLGDVKHFLGMQIEREEDGSFLINQSHKIQEVIETFGLNDAKPVNSPMETNYLKELNNSINPLQNDSQFRRAMGKLLYIATVARPDIATAVGFLCRKVSQPTQMDWNAAKRIIRYLKGTIDFKLKFSSTGKSGLTGYVDADWAGDPSDRKSTSGHLFLFKDGLISWTTRKQSTVTLSSTEAEYVAASQAGQEVIWLRQFLEDLDQIQKESTPIYEDNQGCIALAQTERINPRTKHIDVRYHFLRDLQEQGQMDLRYCPTEEMLADILTKPLPAKRHMDLTRRIGLSN